MWPFTKPNVESSPEIHPPTEPELPLEELVDVTARKIIDQRRAIQRAKQQREAELAAKPLPPIYFTTAIEYLIGQMDSKQSTILIGKSNCIRNGGAYEDWARMAPALIALLSDKDVEVSMNAEFVSVRTESFRAYLERISKATIELPNTITTSAYR